MTTAEKIREQMKECFEKVMILEATSNVAHRMGMADPANKAESLRILNECFAEVKNLQAEHRRLNEEYKRLTNS